jgi:ribosome-associated protein
MIARKTSRPPARAALLKVVNAALSEMKALSVTVLDVRNVTDVTDAMIIASGTSDRHVRSIADRVVERAKQAGFRPFGLEGEGDGEWVLVDLNDIIVHVMLPRVREFYALENLWDIRPPAAEGKAAAKKAPAKRKLPAKGKSVAKGKTAAKGKSSLKAKAKGKSAATKPRAAAKSAAPKKKAPVRDRRKSA